jgi:UDP-2,3-diacylglucosamine hydrolase
MELPAGKKIYFASDFHLGVPDAASSLEREKRVVRWLDSIAHDAQEIFLVGDIFDFWFEYKHAIPKGFIRLQGKIAELTDSGIPVHFFTGNHDMWMFDYFPKELGVEMHRAPIEREWNGKSFYIGHGDGLGPGDRGYKFIKKVFAAKWSQWCFARLHPNFGIGMANFWSRKSRAATGNGDKVFHGEENEWLAIYSKEQLKEKHRDFFVFGHRHLPMDIQLNERSRYINLGEWLNYNTYAVFDGEKLTLETFHG